MNDFKWPDDLAKYTEYSGEEARTEIEQKIDELENYEGALEEVSPIYDMLAECLESDEIRRRYREAREVAQTTVAVRDLLTEAYSLVSEAEAERDEQVLVWARAKEESPPNVRATVVRLPSVRRLVKIADKLMSLDPILSEGHDWLMVDILGGGLDATGVYKKLEAKVPADEIESGYDLVLGFIADVSDQLNNEALIDDHIEAEEDEPDDEDDAEDDDEEEGDDGEHDENDE